MSHKVGQVLDLSLARPVGVSGVVLLVVVVVLVVGVVAAVAVVGAAAASSVGLAWKLGEEKYD